MIANTQKQCLLTYLGYDTGGVYGLFRDKSRQAMEQYLDNWKAVPV